MDNFITLPLVFLLELVTIVAAIIAGWYFGARRGRKILLTEQEEIISGKRKLADEEAARIVSEADSRAKQIEIKARDEMLKLTGEAEESIKRRRAEVDREIERLDRRREEMDRKVERVEQRDRDLNKRQSAIDKRKQDLDKMVEERKAELERVAQMTRDEARGELLAAVETEARSDMARRMRELEEELKEDSDRRARDVISLAIQRLASDQVSELTVSTVSLPSDEMKGRIIGRNGRNIRAFEQATGVDVVVDDTPEAVTISSFDPVRREVARRALSKLVLDGRIHPARIEKLVEDARKEVERVVREEGEGAAYQAGVPGLHPEVIKMLGRLKFRTSFGQNQLAHSIETAHLAGMIAAELGADVALVKMGGLLHDIGKAMDHEIEGTHALIGAEFCKRYGVNDKVINAIASHHHEVEQEYVESIIVEAADAISGARPGARRESLETYIKRVRTLEEIANSFDGVEASYALQAGREVRVIVRPDVIDDLAAMRLSRDVAKRIEESMQYPGQIKVQVIRETRSVEYAR
ncbi:MAG: ribonuclease Y [Anaerolineae bacterium]|nr:ribonuclease Y [Anaerolineae bacterium]